ncbi:unnamed protein product [Leptidea sinapis]|uniref:G-protein coupled receptors family 1 profile domain-containing protein n=1 Tax=Leptidea sinapis TaxID=189913 RepID=A0A5E4R0N7_9NEOP|nr:unnamed protein product [Leptidea sinapis]
MVLVTLTRTRRRKSRVTNAWLAGNLMCKMLLVMRAFGLYLSSNVLVCISLDRYFAVVHPLRFLREPDAGGRVQRVLCLRDVLSATAGDQRVLRLHLLGDTTQQNATTASQRAEG